MATAFSHFTSGSWQNLSDRRIICLEDGGKFASGKVDSRVDEETEHSEGGEVFRCRVCRNKITTSAQMMSMNGNHRHVFANPYGKVFEIGCFSAAPGCFSYGPATTECTWFTGCSWRFSLCVSCFTHLGWKYRSAHVGTFFGLILANLISE